ncbi:uncharacterized protein LOC144153311 [Haemaphysalis longicornis]
MWRVHCHVHSTGGTQRPLSSDDDLWPAIIRIKAESLPACSEDQLSFSDESDLLNIGFDTSPSDAATLQQQRAERDAFNLRQWSPDGLFPDFSPNVQPLLHGAPMSAQRHRALSCQLRDEIIRFLDKHKLIQSKNGPTKRQKYCALGRSLDVRYPNMVWDHARPGTKMHCRERNNWSFFIGRLSATRRNQRWNQQKKQQTSQPESTKKRHLWQT